MSRLSRRHVLLGGLTLAAVAACAEKPILADPAEPVPPINERIEALERRHDARIGVFGVDFESGRTVSRLDGERSATAFATCSPATRSPRRNGSSARTGCVATRRRACGPACAQGGPAPTANDPKAENLRPLIGELTTLVMPWLVA